MQGHWQPVVSPLAVNEFGRASSAPPPQAPEEPGFGDYELTEKENRVVSAAAGKIGAWGVISIVFGVLTTGLGAVAIATKNPSGAFYVVYGIVGVVVGVSFHLASGSLKAVTTTQGNDMRHLMHAMRKLDTAFLTQIVTTLVLVAVAAMLVALLLALGIARHA